MASLRRTVEGWMGDLLYEKLGDEPHIETAWSLLRDLVGQQLFGTEFVPVPFIESASYFNQLFVFIKKQNVLSTIGLRRPTYKIIGNMDYLVNRDLSTWTPQFDFSPWDVADGHSMYREYRLRIMSNQRGVEKSIDFKAIEAHTRSAHPPVPGSVIIHRNLLKELNEGRALYVITDVVLATFVKLTVRIGNHHLIFVHDRDMPIGFKYRKYKLRKDGTFETQLDTTLKFFESEAIWLRPEPQPIPNVPLWDYMRRRYRNGSRRKMRHNLTIQPPGEVPDITVRRHDRQDDNILRIERPTVNGVVLRGTDLVQMATNNREDILRNQVFQRMALNPARRGSVSMETLRGSD